MIRHCALDIDENRSLMALSAGPYQPQPTLARDTSADVAIIGGGFTGVSTAYHFSRRFPEKRILLLEARTLANGASGRNGGLMLNWVNTSHDDPELCRRIYDTTLTAIDAIEAIIREHNLPVRYRRTGCMQVFTDSARAEAAHKETEALASLGIPIRFLTGTDLSSRLRMQGARGAVFDESEGWLCGVDFLRALRPILLARGVEIFENTPVLSIREGRPILLKTPGGEVKADAIVLATNGYTPRLGYFRRGLFPLHSHMIATEPTTPQQRETLGWGAFDGFSDDLDRIAFGGLGPQGELCFGGGSNDAYDYLYGNRTRYPGSPGSVPRAFAAISRRLHEYFPQAASLKIAHRWTGTLGITMSRVCSMGVRGEHRNIYYALGYSGHGVVLANLAGRVLCDIYSDDDTRWRKLPFYQRRLGGVPPEPLRWVGYQVYTRLTGRSPRG